MSPTVHVEDTADRGAPGAQSTPPDSADELGHVASETRSGGTPAVSPTVHVADAADRSAPGTQSTPPDSADELGHVARETRPGWTLTVSPTVHRGSGSTGHAVDTTRLRR